MIFGREDDVDDDRLLLATTAEIPGYENEDFMGFAFVSTYEAFAYGTAVRVRPAGE